MAREPGQPQFDTSPDPAKRKREIAKQLGPRLQQLVVSHIENRNHAVFTTLDESTSLNLLGIDICNRETWKTLIEDTEELNKIFALLDEYESIHVVEAPRVREFIPSRQDSPRQDPSENDSGMNARLISDDEIEEARRAVLGVPDHASADTAQDADTIEFAPAQPTTAGRSSFLRRLKSLFGPKK